MLDHPTPLGAQIAALRTAAPGRAAGGLLSDAVQAAIAALFAQIFARLEDLIRLWQSGLLPVPAHRIAAARNPTSRTLGAERQRAARHPSPARRALRATTLDSSHARPARHQMPAIKCQPGKRPQANVPARHPAPPFPPTGIAFAPLPPTANPHHAPARAPPASKPLIQSCCKILLWWTTEACLFYC